MKLLQVLIDSIYVDEPTLLIELNGIILFAGNKIHEITQ